MMIEELVVLEEPETRKEKAALSRGLGREPFGCFSPQLAASLCAEFADLLLVVVIAQ